MSDTRAYIEARDRQVSLNLFDHHYQTATMTYTEELVRTNYVKNFTWMGIPILQYPGDLMVLQELIFQIQPSFIIECGVAFGGLTTFCAHLMYEYSFYPGSLSTIYAVDVEFRRHAIRALDRIIFPRVHRIEASSIDPATVAQITSGVTPPPVTKKDYWEGEIAHQPNVMVLLDSNHTHEHVLQELKLYSPLVSPGSYIVVFDTAIEFFGHLDKNQDRPWGAGDNPYTAVKEFLAGTTEFVRDDMVAARAGITSAIGGWLRRIV